MYHVHGPLKIRGPILDHLLENHRGEALHDLTLHKAQKQEEAERNMGRKVGIAEDRDGCACKKAQPGDSNSVLAGTC